MEVSRVCSKCGLEKPLTDFPYRKDNRCYRRKCKSCHKTYHADYYKTYKPDGESVKAHSKKYRAKIREAVFQAYGGHICACCGETEPAFLCIDHINGGGNEHRKELGRSGYSFYVWLQLSGFPPGFQVLCHNCNIGKHINGGVCPHKGRV